jgi:DNA-binding NarL/FixJ family response regulator
MRIVLAEDNALLREGISLLVKSAGQGHDNLLIAAEPVVIERAVNKHIGNIFRKLGLPTGESGHRRVLAVLAYVNA